MAEEAVVVVVGPGPGRDHDHGEATGPQHTVRLPQRLEIVGYVLKQVGADDGVDAAVGERQGADVGPQEPDLRNQPVRLLQSRRDEIDAEQPCLRVRCPQVLEQVPGRAAEVSNRPARSHRAEPLDHRRPGPDVDEVGATALLVKVLELVGPVDRGTVVDVGQERSETALELPTGLKGGHLAQPHRRSQHLL